jgi:uncharacterized protein YjaG (DUF416 family)
MSTTSSLRFDEGKLVDELERLPPRLRAAFAAASAERQLPAYARFSTLAGAGVPDRLTGVLRSVWDDIETLQPNGSALREQLDLCMSLLPEEEERVSEECAYANDAVASVAYAIRARLSGDSREAMWAARRAYDAIDHYVVTRLNLKIIERANETRIVEHPLIQAELRRQQVDMAQLQGVITNPERQNEAIVELRRRARRAAVVFFDTGLDEQ